MLRSLPLAALILTGPVHSAVLEGKFIPSNPCDPYSINDLDGEAQWPLRATPRQCAQLNTRNPVFAWTAPKSVVSNADGTEVEALFSLTARDGTVRTIRTKRTRLLLPWVLEKSTADNRQIYKWKVSYSVGREEIETPERTFEVTGDFVLPTGLEIAAAARAHPSPRAWPNALKSADLLARINGSMEHPRKVELSASYAKTVIDADLFVTKGEGDPKDVDIVNEHFIHPAPLLTRRDFASEAEWTAYKTKLRHWSSTERRAIELLSFMFHLTKDGKYRDACKERLLLLADWRNEDDDNDPTSMKNQDQANREIALGLAIGLDAFRAIPGGLSDEETKKVSTRLKSRLADIQGEYISLDNSPYDSHAVSGPHWALEALMYVVGMEGFTDAMVADAWTNLITSVGVWGGDADGGFSGGTSYAWSTAGINARTIAAVKLLTNLGVDLTRFPALGNTGMNLIAQTPPARANAWQFQMGSFGDGTDDQRSFVKYAAGTVRLLAYATGRQDYDWYWRTRSDIVARGSESLPYHFLLNGVGPIPAPPTTITMPNAFLFEDAGYVAFHSKTTDSLRSSLYFRSSPQGTTGHAGADNNTFTFVSKGKDVLVSSGFYKSWDDEHFQQWTRHTRAKNGLTMMAAPSETPSSVCSGCVPGIGQAEEIENGVFNKKVFYYTKEANGKLINYHDKDGWMIATGDATNAYRTYEKGTGKWAPLVTNAIRTVAFHPATGVALVYDYATSETPRTWELNFHTLKPLQRSTSSGVLLENGPSNVVLEADGTKTCLSFFGPASTRKTLAATDNPSEVPASPTGYANVVDQFHTRWTTMGAAKEYRALTIITEGCTAKVTPQVLSVPGQPYERPFKASFAGYEITFDKKRVEFNNPQ